MEKKTEGTQERPARQNVQLVIGVVVILLGLLLLAEQFLEVEWLGLLVLPALALVFLLWGGMARQVGPLIAAGILAGVGIGVILVDGPLDHLDDDAQAGVILVSLAVGFGSITLLTALLTDHTAWWPLVPAAITSVIGAAFLVGDRALDAVESIGELWPVFLIVIGLVMLLRYGLARTRPG